MYESYPAYLDQGTILSHYRNPRNKGGLPTRTGIGRAANHSCGDWVQVETQVTDERLEQITFEGQGCSISQAATSMMTSVMQGLHLSEIYDIGRAYEALLVGDVDAGKDERLGDLRSLFPVSRHPVRIACATLCLDALRTALQHRADH